MQQASGRHILFQAAHRVDRKGPRGHNDWWQVTAITSRGKRGTHLSGLVRTAALRTVPEQLYRLRRRHCLQLPVFRHSRKRGHITLPANRSTDQLSLVLPQQLYQPHRGLVTFRKAHEPFARGGSSTPNLNGSNPRYLSRSSGVSSSLSTARSAVQPPTP